MSNKHTDARAIVTLLAKRYRQARIEKNAATSKTPEWLASHNISRCVEAEAAYLAARQLYNEQVNPATELCGHLSVAEVRILFGTMNDKIEAPALGAG